MPGGATARDWPRYRLLNSLAANWCARYIAGLSPVRDCTSGFRAVSAGVLKQISWPRISARGYSFQIQLLAEARRQAANIKEVPIQFAERQQGTSKLGWRDILEFGLNSVKIRFTTAASRQPLYITAGVLLLALAAAALTADFFTLGTAGFTLFFLATFLITAQSLLTLFGMIYAWEDPALVERNNSPRVFRPPHYSFTAILPAYHEETVIADTIRALAAVEYPADKKEVLIVCRYDDAGTIAAVKSTLREIGAPWIRLLVPAYLPKNKPDKLNYALGQAEHDVVCIFDAEDNPHPDIFNIVNTVMCRDGADIVQSGVQLVNFRSNWFSTLNVLEYFFWFKSVLHFFASQQVIPLGGNTVFFKKNWVEKVGGWDADCLTEDADIGIRLSAAGARMRIIYDELHSTHEETPPNAGSFVRQRTRWNQGFIQIFKKREWQKLPTLTQRWLVAYILLWPIAQTSMFLYVSFSLVMMLFIKLPVILAMTSILPLYVLVLHLVIMNVGLYEFTRKYGVRYPFWMPFKVVITFIPFQIMLGLSALRAVYREFTAERGWEKTEHTNRPPLKTATLKLRRPVS